MQEATTKERILASERYAIVLSESLARTPMERVVRPEDASNRVLIYVGAGGELVKSSTFSPPILVRLNNFVEATRTQLAVAMFLLGAGMALLVSFPATPFSRRQGPICATTMILFAGMLFSGGGAVLAFASAGPFIWQNAEWHRLSTIPASIIGALFGLVAGSVLARPEERGARYGGLVWSPFSPAYSVSRVFCWVWLSIPIRTCWAVMP